MIRLRLFRLTSWEVVRYIPCPGAGRRLERRLVRGAPCDLCGAGKAYRYRVTVADGSESRMDGIWCCEEHAIAGNRTGHVDAC